MTLGAIRSEIRSETDVGEAHPNCYSSERAIHRREQPHNTSRAMDADTVAGRLDGAVSGPLESSATELPNYTPEARD